MYRIKTEDPMPSGGTDQERIFGTDDFDDTNLFRDSDPIFSGKADEISIEGFGGNIEDIEIQKLEPEERFCIDADKPLFKTPLFNVVAQINTGDGDGDSFIILDIRKANQTNWLRKAVSYVGQGRRYPFGKAARSKGHGFDEDIDFVLVGSNFNPEDRKKAYKAIRKGTDNSFTIGREQFTDRFEYDESQTSRNHFKVTYDEEGRLSVKDVGSRTGTALRAHEDEDGTWSLLTGRQRDKRKQKVREEHNQYQAELRERYQKQREEIDQKRLKDAERDKEQAVRQKDKKTNPKGTIKINGDGTW